MKLELDLNGVIFFILFVQAFFWFCYWRAFRAFLKSIEPIAGLLEHNADAIWALHKVFMKWGHQLEQITKNVEKIAGEKADSGRD